jgi:outer membrane translocation and assembly module TamA
VECWHVGCEEQDVSSAKFDEGNQAKRNLESAITCDTFLKSKKESWSAPKNLSELIMKKTRNEELDSKLENAIALLDAHTKGITKDLDAEALNLHQLVSDEDSETQEHLKQLDRVVADLKSALGAIRSEIKSAQALANSDGEEPGSVSSDKNGASGSSGSPNLSAEKASKIRHDEPVTIGTVLRSLLMANEPAQRERRKDL